MKYYMCFDTCTWINLANGREPAKFLKDIEELIDLGLLRIILPNIVRDEWNRNKESISNSITYAFGGISKSMKEVSSTIDKIEAKSKFQFLLENNVDIKKEFNEISSKLDDNKKHLIDKVQDNISTIEKIFDDPATILVAHNQEILLKAADIALQKKAPIHNKNGFADAVILLSFIEYTKSKSLSNSYFVSYNASDFCKSLKDKGSLHSDIEPLFVETGCHFFGIVGKALKSIDPQLVNDAMMKEIVKSFADDDYYCTECDGYHGFGNQIDFSEPFSIINENFSKYNNIEPALFSENEIGTIASPKLIDEIQIGYCNHCSQQYIKCQGCGEVLSLGDYDVIYGYNGDIFVCSCGIRYKRETEFDRQGIEEEIWTIINDKTETCQSCGETFIDKIGTGICSHCEEEYNNK